MAERKANIKMAAKYFSKAKGEIDTVKQRKDNSYRKANDVLMDAYNAWNSLDSFRQKSRRNKMYTFEDQWGDRVKTRCGWMTERNSILNEGNIPLTNNRIRGIVRSVSGVFQSQQTEPVCIDTKRENQSKGEIMTAALQYVYYHNKLWGLDGYNFNNFLVTGLAAFKSVYSWRNDKEDVWTDYINYNRIFFDNHMQDPRHWDCHLIGEIHDVGLYDVIDRFWDESEEKAERIRQIYSYCNKERTMEYLNSITDDRNQNLNFFVAEDQTRCRVIEIWKKESKKRLKVHDTLTGDYYKAELNEIASLDAENRKRMEENTAEGVEPQDMRLIKYKRFIDNYWYYYFMSPQGDILDEGETPYWHKSHPYSFRVYPFFDGQVFPFVSDFIDQQRMINRLIMLQDFLIRASAKGVLAIDQSSIPDGYTIQDIADEWAVFNGVILYTTKNNPNARLPQQITSNTNQLGITDMLQIQLKLLEDISGVQGALQGKAPNSGTPAALYMQQTQNATTSITELFDVYRGLREERDYKNMKLIQQFYTEPRYILISGAGNRMKPMIYNPKDVVNAEFELRITESTATPAYRLIMNDFLMQLFTAGQITLNELLENGAFPFADKLMQSIQSRQNEMQQAQSAMMQGGQMPAAQSGAMVDSATQQQLDQNVNPLIQKMFNNQAA